MNYTARISVFGGRDIDEQTYADAVEIGKQLAAENYLVFAGAEKGLWRQWQKG